MRIRPEKAPDAADDREVDARDSAPATSDPLPADPCDPVGLLPAVPRDVPGWTADPAPVFPYELFAAIPVGFVGRLFRAESGCAVVGVSRPADLEAVVKALTAERPRTMDVGGRQGMVLPSAPANQVTIWVRDGVDRLVLLRAYGTVDPDVLQPFLDALFPSPADGDAGPATSGQDAGAGPADAGPDGHVEAEEPPDCSGRYPIADPYDPSTFWGPPGDCWR